MPPMPGSFAQPSRQTPSPTRRASNGGSAFALGALMAVASLGLGSVQAAEVANPISVELNKLESNGKSCRAYIVVNNPSDAALQVMKLDLIFFRPDAVIERRLAVDLGPVRPAKKTVKTFDLDALPCETIGSVLVNDVIDCRDASGPVAECLGRVVVSSRAAVSLSK